MNILNVNFTEINAKKGNNPKGKLSINNNIKLENVEESKLGADDTKKAVKVDFKFSTTYSPDYATIDLKGSLLVFDEAKKADEMLKSWKENKNLTKEHSKNIVQTIMNRSLIQTVVISKELELPAPIKLPTVKDGAEAQK